MTQTNHVDTTLEMATNSSYTYTFQGFQAQNYVVSIESLQDILYFDGKSIFSDGALSIGTTNSNPVYFGADSTEYLKIETDGKINFLSGKMSINGDTGAVGQFLQTDGNGNISWATVDYTQNAFSNIAVSGEVTVTADTTEDTLTLIAGSGIDISTSGNNVTIASDSTAHNAFKFMDVIAGAGQASGSTIEADNQNDTLTFVAGQGIDLDFNTQNDRITISSVQVGESNQNAITNIEVSGQSTISSGSQTDTLELATSTDRNQLEITTDTSTNTVNLKAVLPRTLSMSGRIPTRLSDGTLSGMPINNHFINRSVSGAEVSGGGTSVGFSTRAVVCNEADGTVHKVTMPASNNNSLLFTLRESDGSTTQEFEIDMAESAI
jgi:hypothetical protein